MKNNQNENQFNNSTILTTLLKKRRISIIKDHLGKLKNKTNFNTNYFKRKNFNQQENSNQKDKTLSTYEKDHNYGQNINPQMMKYRKELLGNNEEKIMNPISNSKEVISQYENNSIIIEHKYKEMLKKNTEETKKSLNKMETDVEK